MLDKLKKMKPSLPAQAEAAEDLEMLAGEDIEDMDIAKSLGGPSEGPASSLSDDELMAEMKKRGLGGMEKAKKVATVEGPLGEDEDMEEPTEDESY